MPSNEFHRITTESTSDASEISPPLRPSSPRFGHRPSGGRRPIESTSDASEISPPPRPSSPRFGQGSDTSPDRRVNHEIAGQPEVLQALSRWTALAILGQDISTAAAREPQSLVGAMEQIRAELHQEHQEEEARKPFHETEVAATWRAFNKAYGEEKDEKQS